MNKAIRVVASLFGVFAGFGGIEHGAFEILQGNVIPEGIMISSIGPPCEVDQVWNACEPALTVIPNFLATGIIAVVLGIGTMIWSAAFVQRKYGGQVLITLSIMLLLFGGGIFPPLIGIIGVAVGTRINAPLIWWRGLLSGKLLRFLAMLWPWSLAAFFIWLFGQWIVGYFYPEFMLQNALLSPLFIIVLLVLTVFTAFANDIHNDDGAKVA